MDDEKALVSDSLQSVISPWARNVQRVQKLVGVRRAHIPEREVRQLEVETGMFRLAGFGSGARSPLSHELPAQAQATSATARYRVERGGRSCNHCVSS